MKILIMALSLLVAPFFLHADIFHDGTVDVQAPKTTDIDTGYCNTSLTGNSEERMSASECVGIGQANLPDVDLYDCWEVAGNNEIKNFCKYDDDKYAEPQSAYISRWFGFLTVPLTLCPPESFPRYVSPVMNETGELEGCYDPAQANLVDDCNLNSTDQYLAVPVTAPIGCFTTSNGSQCKYKSVDVGNGVNAYELDLEGDCYTDLFPDIEGDPETTTTPTNSEDTCKPWGGTGMICREKREDVCDMYGNCNEGCGTVNGTFVCIDADRDGDGVPDYLDPDVDGDGVRNEVDLDNDGDGIDDSIDLSKPKEGEIDIDLSPIVNELKKGNAELSEIGQGVDMLNNDLKFLAKDVSDIKESITEVGTYKQDKPKGGLKGFWETDYPEGLQGVVDAKMAEVQSTQFFTFLEQFQISVGGSSATYDMCFDLGGMGNLGCHNFDIDPRTFPAIKIFILISAVFLCRRILFGG
jgi:hypothetical protein